MGGSGAHRRVRQEIAIQEIAMRLLHYSLAAFAATALGAGLAVAQSDVPPPDTQTVIDGVETVCTGSALEAREDPRWRNYPFHLEFVGKDGQYLGDEMVSVTGNGHSVSVHCDGPWVLMKLPRGSYHVAVDVAEAGHRDVTVRSPAHRIMRFPYAGGEVSSLPRSRRVASE
jgi:hypothetical protein